MASSTQSSTEAGLEWSTLEKGLVEVSQLYQDEVDRAQSHVETVRTQLDDAEILALDCAKQANEITDTLVSYRETLLKLNAQSQSKKELCDARIEKINNHAEALGMDDAEVNKLIANLQGNPSDLPNVKKSAFLSTYCTMHSEYVSACDERDRIQAATLECEKMQCHKWIAADNASVEARRTRSELSIAEQVKGKRNEEVVLLQQITDYMQAVSRVNRNASGQLLPTIQNIPMLTAVSMGSLGLDRRILQLLSCVGWSASDFKTAGYSAIQCRMAGHPPGELSSAGYSILPALTARSTWPTGSELIEFIRTRKLEGETVEKLHQSGFSVCELRRAGFTAADLCYKIKSGGCTLAELKSAGFDAQQLQAMAQIKVKELKDAGFEANELRKIFAVAELVAGGFSADNLRRGGCTPAELKSGGFGVADMRNVGICVAELYEIGFTVAELKDGGCKSR